MTIKVVINRCYGGFGLSAAAEARVEQLTGEDFEFYSHPRHCASLVQVVEEMGGAANGSCAELSIETLKGNKYVVREYDGTEWIEEPEDVDWIEVIR